MNAILTEKSNVLQEQGFLRRSTKLVIKTPVLLCQSRAKSLERKIFPEYFTLLQIFFEENGLVNKH
jgi:hypothetical protein